ncbi:MAG: 3-hydroxybutyrate dehydrogenase [Granulosicoccus sp.]|nr:3-hydroxybutyrate dehydrogenase [Granulosicoccus sp.]
MSNTRTAVVTGSTSGIGKGIAESLAASGMNIVLNGIEPADKVEETRENISRSHGVQVVYAPANLMQADECAGLAAFAMENFGRVDVLVNNAGIQFVSPIEEFPNEKWEAILSLNLSAAFYTTKAIASVMKAQKWGRIINIASAHGLVASPYKSAYVAAKHGLIGLTKTVALELAEFGVTVNAICPGYVWTPLVEKQIPDTAQARGLTEKQVINDVLLAAQPNKKFASIEEIGALTSFLASDNAASITGTSVSVDGGWTAH